MRILGIETSCDETGAAVIERNPSDKKVTLLSNVVTSSLALHEKTGGIIPEVAAREQLKYILPVIEQALREAGIRHSGLSRIPTVSDSGVANAPQNDGNNIDAIAVTIGPGLIGSLLVGVETAKTLAYVWKKPVIPVNHLIGHIYANFIQMTDDRIQKTDTRKTEDTEDLSSVSSEIRSPSSVFSPPTFPAVALIVSGGHTDLILMQNHQRLTWVGGTRDDAAGEAFDKIGRFLGLPYPAGPVIDKLAEKGNPKAYTFPRPMIDSENFDFSFSGLKTAVLRERRAMKQLSNETIADLSASIQQAIVDVLVAKTLKAAQKYEVKSILLSGGVGANQKLREAFQSSIIDNKLSIKFFVPPKNLCTDNAAMIATAAFFNYNPISWKRIAVNPELHF